MKNVQRIISSASFSKIVSEDPNLIFYSSNQDDVILDENPRSSGCEEFIDEALEIKFDDSSMIKNHIVKVTSPMTLSIGEHNDSFTW